MLDTNLMAQGFLLITSNDPAFAFASSNLSYCPCVFELVCCPLTGLFDELWLLDRDFVKLYGGVARA